MAEEPFDDESSKGLGDGLQADLQRKALAATVQAIEQKVGGLVCPAHQKRPSLKFSEGAGPGRQNIGFDCCCDQLGQMVQEALKG